MAAETPVLLSFEPREGIPRIELYGALSMPEPACLIAERAISNQTWKDLLGKLGDDMATQTERVLKAPSRERLEVFATSGLASQTVDGERLETTIYSAVETAFREVSDHGMAEKIEAAFIMLRIYLQGRNVLVVQGEMREWFAGVLETAFEHVRPFVFRDVVSQIDMACVALRSGSEMSVLVSVGQPSWKPHWTQNMRKPGVLEKIVAFYGVQAPLFCDHLQCLSTKALEHVGESFYDDIIAQQDNVSFTFDLHANMASMTRDAFNLSRLSTTYVFSHPKLQLIDFNYRGCSGAVDTQELVQANPLSSHRLSSEPIADSFLDFDF